MAVLRVGKLPDDVHRALRVRAAEHGRLPFDEAAASSYADLAVGARAKGRGFIVASLNTAPFEAGGLPVVNPWMVGG